MLEKKRNSLSRNRFSKAERLKSSEEIKHLFTRADSFKLGCLRFFYHSSFTTSNYPKVVFSAPKKHFKTAVQRNLLKRLMREAYRKNKYIFGNQFPRNIAFLIRYQPTKHAQIEQDMILVLEKYKIQKLGLSLGC